MPPAALLSMMASFAGAAAPVAAAPAQAGPPQPEREWVVKDVIPPQPFEPDAAFEWLWGYGVGDPSRDGMADFLIKGWNYSPGDTSTEVVAGTLSLAAGARGFVTYRPTGGGFQFSPQGAALLRRRSVLAFAIIEPNVLHAPQVWELPSWNYIGSVPLPPPPGNGRPAMAGFQTLQWAGDVDGDGFDDLFYQGITPPAHFYAGMIDGASLSVRWQQYVTPNDEVWDPTAYGGPEPPPDLNRDGAPDFISSNTLFIVPGQLPFEHLIQAYSGRDGTLLWERSILDRDWGIYPSTGRDLNGDGIADLIWGAHDPAGTLGALDGATGNILWERSNRILDGVLPPTAEYFFIQPTLMTGRLGAPGEAEVAMVVFTWEPVGYYFEYDHLIVHLDPSTGALLEVEEFPPDLEPWTPDSVQLPRRGPQIWHFLLGDTDRDGFTELGRQVVKGPFDPYGGVYPSFHFAIFGQKTLFLPPQVRLGATEALTVSIPTAAGKPFAVLASSVFRADGGVRISGWRTHLGHSELLRQSLNGLPLSGALDARGEATLAFTVPPNLILADQPFYFKALVYDPAVPGGVFTSSTLATTEVTN